MQKARGRVECGGQSGLARKLAGALTAPAKEDDRKHALTHGVHGYPARMHPATTRHILAALEPRSVLDPFCGSGTTLVEARAAGIRATGVELNDIAVRVASAKTWVTSKKRRAQLDSIGAEIATAAKEAGRRARKGESDPVRGNRKRDRALSGWFAPHVRRELEWLYARVQEVEEEDFRSALTVCLSSILYKMSFRASDTDGRKIKRQVPRGAVARNFAGKVDELVRGLSELSQVRGGGHPQVLQGDARKLSRLGIGEGGFDAVVTSPPYAGTYDYSASQDLRAAFFGWNDSAKLEIGSRRRFEHKAGDGVQRALRTWRKDFSMALAESVRSLRPGGSIALVIGDSLAGNTAVYADDVVSELLQDMASLKAWAWQERPKLGAKERRAFKDRPKREHILVFEK